jgi:hypothetical protein
MKDEELDRLVEAALDSWVHDAYVEFLNHNPRFEGNGEPQFLSDAEATV